LVARKSSAAFKASWDAYARKPEPVSKPVIAPVLPQKSASKSKRQPKDSGKGHAHGRGLRTGKAPPAAPVEQLVPPSVKLIPDFVLHDGLRERQPMPYAEYLQSRHWSIVRAKVLLAAHYRCRNCGDGGPLQVHHTDYSHLWYEWDTDVVCLCATCHALEHGWYIYTG
jgi:hypothetical protein